MKRGLMVLAGMLLSLAAIEPISATPLACTGTCRIDSVITGYVPPILEISDGASVTWRSLDSGHAHWEARLPTSPGLPCFKVGSTVGTDSSPVTFDIDGSLLNATIGSTTQTCGGATQLPGGGLALHYFCQFHENMRGVLVVAP